MGLPQSESAQGAERGTKLQRGSKVKNGTSQPEVLIGSMPESQRSKCQESTG